MSWYPEAEINLLLDVVGENPTAGVKKTVLKKLHEMLCRAYNAGYEMRLEQERECAREEDDEWEDDEEAA